MSQSGAYQASAAIGGVERMNVEANQAYKVSSAIGGVERMNVEENQAYKLSTAVDSAEMEENRAYVSATVSGMERMKVERKEEQRVPELISSMEIGTGSNLQGSYDNTQLEGPYILISQSGEQHEYMHVI